MRSILRTCLISFVSILAILILTGPVQAAPLPVGGTLFPTPAEPDPTGGMVVAGPVATPFAVAGFFTGTLFTTVISGDPSNPLGGLTFVYRLDNAPASPNQIGRLTLSDFSGFLTDVSYKPTGGLPPASAERPAPSGVSFNFTSLFGGPGPLFPGMISNDLVIQTNAPAFQNGLASIIDSGAINVGTLVPAVPEPSTLGLIAATTLLLRRRR